MWTDVLQKLQQGKLDVICSAVTVTPERKRFLNFSDPYLSFRLCAVTNKEDNKNSLDELNKKNIGVRKATEAEKFINTHLKKVNIIFSDTNEELYQLLKSKKADLLIDDSPIAGGFVKQNDNLKVAFFLPGTDSEYSIALKKGNKKLKNAIDKTLKEMKTNSVYQRIYDKWFKNIAL